MVQRSTTQREVRTKQVTYGYARISTRDQNLARQIDALEAFGVERACIFADKASGKDFHRPAYQRLVRRLHAGDTVVIKSIDRLGRNYDDILEEWRRLTKNSCAHLVVLRHAAARHSPRGEWRDRRVHCRHGAAAAELRGAYRARQYPAAPGRGHRGGSGAGRALRAAAHRAPRCIRNSQGAL